MADVLASRSEEGRVRLRKAQESCQEAKNLGCPNGETFKVGDLKSLSE